MRAFSLKDDLELLLVIHRQPKSVFLKFLYNLFKESQSLYKSEGFIGWALLTPNAVLLFCLSANQSELNKSDVMSLITLSMLLSPPCYWPFFSQIAMNKIIFLIFVLSFALCDQNFQSEGERWYWIQYNAKCLCKICNTMPDTWISLWCNFVIVWVNVDCWIRCKMRDGRMD